MVERRIVSGVLAALAVAVAATPAHGETSVPGVTRTSVVIGGTFPFTGPASLYSVIPKAEDAYYQWVNAHGGVHGRKIVFKVYDDQYNPALTVPLTHRLVEQDRVFAIVNSLGTATNLATRGYLNQHEVPQVLLASGDSYWGAQYRTYPWTIGFQPDYIGESRIYGTFIRTKVPQAKIGVLVQDDAYGRDFYDGLLQGLGPARSKIVDVERYDPTSTDVSQQVVKLKAKGANVFALFALPSQTIDALVTATKIGWQPTTFINSVSASPHFMALAVKSGADIDGDITVQALLDVVNEPDSPAARLYRSILSRYDAGADPLDSSNLYGVAVAWTFVRALEATGRDLTRAGLMQALTHMDWVDPFLYSGITLKTTPTQHFPVDQQSLTRWSRGAFHPFGHLFDDAR